MDKGALQEQPEDVCKSSDQGTEEQNPERKETENEASNESDPATPAAAFDSTISIMAYAHFFKSVLANKGFKDHLLGLPMRLTEMAEHLFPYIKGEVEKVPASVDPDRIFVTEMGPEDEPCNPGLFVVEGMVFLCENLADRVPSMPTLGLLREFYLGKVEEILDKPITTLEEIMGTMGLNEQNSE